MKFAFSAWAMRACICLAAIGAPTLDGENLKSFGYPGAFAQSAGTTEKEAFEAAKELGTVEAWDAFLSNYPTGFHADLARAYVKKLGEAAPARSEPAPPVAPAADEFPVPAGSWGGVVRDGPGKQYRQIDSLDEGEAITLMGRSDVFEDGYPWFKIAYRDGKIGFKWGGILCSTGAERSDIYKTCTTTTTQKKAEPQKVKKTQQGCSGGRIKVDGRCILKHEAKSFCGPGFRVQGNKCVSNGVAAKPVKPRCPKGQVWNAQEGCHYDD